MIEKIKLCESDFKERVSPFDKIVCLGYYDGPTSGLAKCAKSQMAYRFELVSWDSHCENRIYSLAETSVQVFDSIIQTLSRLGVPHWPFWVPRWSFDSPEEEASISLKINEALARIPAANLLVATDHFDRDILACRILESRVHRLIPKAGTLPTPKDWEFWWAYLGLGKN